MRSYLMALQSIDPFIKGVRRNLQGEIDQAFCLLPDFVRGVQLVAKYGFSFDICIGRLQAFSRHAARSSSLRSVAPIDFFFVSNRAS